MATCPLAAVFRDAGLNLLPYPLEIALRQVLKLGATLGECCLHNEEQVLEACRGDHLAVGVPEP